MSTPEKPVPAGLYSPFTHPPIVLDDLEVGSLYLMISVPLSIYLGRRQHSHADLDPFSVYEPNVAQAIVAEDFHWDLYWHTRSSPDGGSGVVYRLRSVTTNGQNDYDYDRVPVFRVRTHAQLVGLVRVVSVPPAVVPHLTRYLDWVVAESARNVPKQPGGSFVWAASVYCRAREHLTKGGGVRDHSFHQFDVERFASETLSFAYREVPDVLVGRYEGPRPVVSSWLGVSLRFLEDDEVASTKRRRDELLRRQREQFKAVRSCWYH